MPYADLREYIDRLEREGDLKRITAEVDWNLELGAVMRRANDLREPALLFESIKGCSPEYRVLANMVGASKGNPYGRLCRAMDLPYDTPPLEIIDEFIRRFQNPIRPVQVDNAPCKENIIKGEDVDLTRFPSPHFRPMDGGRFMGTWHTDVTASRDRSWVNWGMYRHMLHDKQTLGWLANPGQHGPGIYYQQYESKGEAMPFAIAIGTEPACSLATISLIPANIDEADLAGGLRGKPIELIKCETNDLLVPASAEIVLEGEVLPYERRPEGPFGEYPGYFASDSSPRPVIHINCITHRNNPILTVSSPGKPFDDTTFVYALCGSAALTMELRRLGLPFNKVFLTPEMMGVIISARETYPGFVHTLSSAVWSTKVGVYRPTVIVVGEDVDVSNAEEVLWAMTTRIHPVRDIHVQKRAPSSPLFPFVSPDERTTLTGANVCYDATFPFEWKDQAPKVVDFEHAWPEEIKGRVAQRWEEYGLGKENKQG
ncbi:MAG: 3-octaprenyl-4-hydroxybenzoate carboxy-lyase [Syntrophorhabdaceae bacterium PtaU1.Bin034]|nr:MAG: 3-octaprenyl-4-hydroxybenzoate carboxy-lyase [Syntrophorhabdaceae bacterium PtaU1.Bin034]